MSKDVSIGYMTPGQRQCPLCGGTYEHDKDCELSALSIAEAAKLGLLMSRREIKRRAEQERPDS